MTEASRHCGRISKPIKYLGLLVILVLSVQSHSNSSPEDGIDWTIEKITESAKDIRLPNRIWDLLPKKKGAVVANDSSNQFFVPLKVMLREKNPGVLTEKAIKIEFPKGGGMVNFAKYVSAKNGTFYVDFEFEGLEFPDQVKVFYVSRARKRRIDGKIHGTGCNKFLDITQYILDLKAHHQGITLNSTRQRHLTTIGGSFIFAYKKDNQTFLSQASFVDDRSPNLFCDNKVEAHAPENAKNE